MYDEYTKCGYANPKDEYDCFVADLKTGFSCCLINDGSNKTCALLTSAGRKSFEAKFNTTANLTCSRELSAGYISYSLILSLAYMILF